MKLEYNGEFTQGHYNDMEGEYQVFIDGDPLSDIVKELLSKEKLPTNFCYDWDSGGGRDLVKNNKLIGVQVKLTLEFEQPKQEKT